MQRPYFHTVGKPEPAITASGLCFTINSKTMNQVFEHNQYIFSFETVFGKNSEKQLWKGDDTELLEFGMNMHIQPLTDRTATSGVFWYYIT